jgi:hypothetical protein
LDQGTFSGGADKRGRFQYLIDRVPDPPQSVGACLVVAGWLGTIIALPLQDFPLSLASFLLYGAGRIGPKLHALKRRKNAQPAAGNDTAEEDAAVDARIRELEAEQAVAGQYRELAPVYRPGRDRLH